MPVPRDTSTVAYAAYVEQLRQAGPEARVAMAAELSDAVHQLALAAIRRRQPDLDDSQVARALVEQLHGTLGRPTPDG